MLERKKVPITGQNENAKWEKVKVGKASISSLKNSGKRAMTVKFKQVSKAAGYEVLYSTNKKFSGGNGKNT